MLPIVGHPGVVTANIGRFRKFFTDAGVRHCQDYLTGLIVSPTVTVNGMTRFLVNGSDQSNLNRFLTHAEWDERAVNEERIRLLQDHPETRWKKRGAVSIDDTLLHKDGLHIYGVSKHYDSGEGRYVQAQQLVTTHYADGTRTYPIEYRQWLKEDSLEAKEAGFKTKIQLACELVDDAIAKGCPAECFVFDSWFLCEEVTQRIQSHGRAWVGGVRSNRNIVRDTTVHVGDFLASLSESAWRKLTVDGNEYRVYSAGVRMSKLGRVRLVAAYREDKRDGDEPIIIASNRVDWPPELILHYYKLRWSIEEFYRDAKQNLGLGECQLRDATGIRRHWYLVFLAYSFLRLGASRSRLGRLLEANLSVGGMCVGAARDLVAKLVVWVCKEFASETGDSFRMPSSRQAVRLAQVLLA